MKVAASCIVLNEEEYVWYALKSVYSVVDEICLVHGACRDKAVPGTYTEEGLSIDSTGAIIQSFIETQDPASKVIYRPVGLLDSKDELRNVTIEMMSDDVTHIFVVDGDTIYDADELRGLFSWVKDKPWVVCVLGEQLMFWRDFWTVLTVPKQYRRKCGYWNPWFFYQRRGGLTYHNQCVLYDDGLRIAECPYVPVSIASKMCKESVIPNEPLFRFWHLGWARSQARLQGHLDVALWRWLERWNSMSEEEYGKLLKDPPNERALINHQFRGKNMVWARRWARFFHKVYISNYDARVEEHEEHYDGYYPPYMRAHPYYSGKYDLSSLGWDFDPRRG